MSRIEPFTLHVEQDVLDDLRRRLLRTRRPPTVRHDWERGTSSDALDRLLAHWSGPFDWRAVERRLNALDHVRVEVEGLRLHAVRAGTPGTTPLLLLHGWPDGVLRFEAALPLLAPHAELVVPSLPGYGWSDIPADPTGPARVADLLADLMTALGHERFGVHGGDIGSTIGEQLALRHPSRVLGLHLGDAPLHRPRSLTADERTPVDEEWLARLAAWDAPGGGSAYARLQRSRPQTLAVSLEDSPAGLAAWFLEKFHAWTDPDGDVFDAFSLDDLCANLTVYWATRTAGSSADYYFDNAHSVLGTGRVTVPTAFAQFPRDILPAPRASVERWFDVVRWTEFPDGGHFGPWQHPRVWADDVIAFFRGIGG